MFNRTVPHQNVYVIANSYSNPASGSEWCKQCDNQTEGFALIREVDIGVRWSSAVYQVLILNARMRFWRICLQTNCKILPGRRQNEWINFPKIAQNSCLLSQQRLMGNECLPGHWKQVTSLLPAFARIFEQDIGHGQNSPKGQPFAS